MSNVKKYQDPGQRITFKIPSQAYRNVREIVEYGTKQGVKDLTVDRYCRTVLLTHLQDLIKKANEGAQNAELQESQARVDEVGEVPTETSGPQADQGEDL